MTARDHYRKLNNNNAIPDMGGELCFTPDQMIWFAQDYANHVLEDRISKIKKLPIMVPVCRCNNRIERNDVINYCAYCHRPLPEPKK